MLIVHVFVHVKPESLDAFTAATSENARNSIREPGVVRFDVIQQDPVVRRAKVETTGGVFQVREDERRRGLGRDCTRRRDTRMTHGNGGLGPW